MPATLEIGIYVLGSSALVNIYQGHQHGACAPKISDSGLAMPRLRHALEHAMSGAHRAGHMHGRCTLCNLSRVVRWRSEALGLRIAGAQHWQRRQDQAFFPSIAGAPSVPLRQSFVVCMGALYNMAVYQNGRLCGKHRVHCEPRRASSYGLAAVICGRRCDTSMVLQLVAPP